MPLNSCLRGIQENQFLPSMDTPLNLERLLMVAKWEFIAKARINGWWLCGRSSLCGAFRGPPMSTPALVAWIHTICLIRILICDLGPTFCTVSCQHMSVALKSCALTQQVHSRTRFHSDDSGHELRLSLQVCFSLYHWTV